MEAPKPASAEGGALVQPAAPPPPPPLLFRRMGTNHRITKGASRRLS